MIIIRIGKRKYKGVYRWEDVTLQMFCDLAAIPMPEGYEDYILADGKFSVESIDEYVQAVSMITSDQIEVTFPAYFRKVIGCLTNIPEKVIEGLPVERVNDLYEVYFKPFVLSLVYNTPVIHFMGEVAAYQPEQVEKFRLGLRTFYLPQSIRVMDQEIPLMREPIITYTEASDIFRGMKVSKDDVKKLALFMAIYCRKKREKYDERKALNRQDLFMKARMSVVWGVFFCTLRRLPDSSMITLLFGRLPRQIREVVHQARTYKDMALVH